MDRKKQLMNEFEEWCKTPPMQSLLSRHPEHKQSLREIQEKIPVSLKELVKDSLVRTALSDLKNIRLAFELCGLFD